MTIVCDGHQPLVKRCDICDVSLKSSCDSRDIMRVHLQSPTVAEECDNKDERTNSNQKITSLQILKSIEIEMDYLSLKLKKGATTIWHRDMKTRTLGTIIVKRTNDDK